MTVKYLITGATGDLGGGVLDYFIANVDFTEFTASSSNPDNRSLFENRGVNFRHLDYEDPATLRTALRDVQNLLLVSTATGVIHIERIERHHRNVVDAARQENVKHVWYTSLTFGGLTNDSEVPMQRAHLATEKMLQESGLTFTSIREGMYAEGFPVFLNWYPNETLVILPDDGEIAFTSRAELAECTARLMLRGGFENRTLLLTAGGTITGKEIINLINETTGRNVKLQYVSPGAYLNMTNANFLCGNVS
ncbi:hypothetical protein PENARI_c056G01555 [Penicillium arizonense]|uniref:NmrA-like domain-containing protein n=1 Tax=Penicillium arizonense TaxID=1835702 RepID=A0A1F5L1U1_PENAI|nr:hypothetical protein PENARI_c056G01555 [Penicillium arizonense]OGE47193.1 hypothetical protein PENARI_c056G01555 [Penicillium arizonense]